MASCKEVQRRRGTTAEHNTFTGAEGEITVDTDKKAVVVHDGSTAGGAPLLLEDRSNTPFQLGSYRNKIINGNFGIWQRRTTAVTGGSTSIVTGYIADRWLVGSNPDGGTSASVTTTRESFTAGQTDVPGEPEYFHRVTNSTTGSGQGAGSWDILQQNIENNRTFDNGEDVTISFYARSSITNKRLAVRFMWFGQTTQNYFEGEYVDITSDWAKYTVTVQCPDMSGDTYSTNQRSSGIQTVFFFQHGSNEFLGGGSTLDWQGTGTVDIANVQVEASPVATPFEQRSFGEEMTLCQRYYEKSYSRDVIPGTITSAGSIRRRPLPGGYYLSTDRVMYKVRKRVAATVTIYAPETGNTGNVSLFRSGSWQDHTSNVFNSQQKSCGQYTLDTYTFDEQYKFQWTADAEF